MNTPNRCYSIAKRTFDLTLASAGLVFTGGAMLVVAAAIRSTSKGPALHWSRRIGRHNREFLMPKFRTMRTDTPQLPTHLLTQAHDYVTPIGRALRATSLDELPQLLSILAGDMSFVGPRPALFNQDDLVALRTDLGVHELLPGLTGWAQINGRDELSIPEKVRLDAHYLARRSLAFDLEIILKTLSKAVTGEGVSH